MVWAARYSTDIARDFARGRSFAGWSLSPAPTPRAAWREYAEVFWYDRLQHPRYADEDEALDSLIDDLEREGYEPLPVEDGSGWVITTPGLCAFVGDTPGDAIDLARSAGWRFEGIPLWVFEADELGPDPAEPEFSLVRPRGPARPAAVFETDEIAPDPA